VYVWSVEPLSPADKGGLERLDVIPEGDGEEITDTVDLRTVLFQEKEVDEDVEITYYREGAKQETTIKLAGRSYMSYKERCYLDNFRVTPIFYSHIYPHIIQFIPKNL